MVQQVKCGTLLYCSVVKQMITTEIRMTKINQLVRYVMAKQVAGSQVPKPTFKSVAECYML